MGRRKLEPVARHHIRIPVSLAAQIELHVCDEHGATTYGGLSGFYQAAAEYYLEALKEGKS